MRHFHIPKSYPMRGSALLQYAEFYPKRVKEQTGQFYYFIKLSSFTGEGIIVPILRRTYSPALWQAKFYLPQQPSALKQKTLLF